MPSPTTCGKKGGGLGSMVVNNIIHLEQVSHVLITLNYLTSSNKVLTLFTCLKYLDTVTQISLYHFQFFQAKFTHTLFLIKKKLVPLVCFTFIYFVCGCTCAMVHLWKSENLQLVLPFHPLGQSKATEELYQNFTERYKDDSTNPKYGIGERNQKRYY